MLLGLSEANTPAAESIPLVKTAGGVSVGSGQGSFAGYMKNVPAQGAQPELVPELPELPELPEMPPPPSFRTDGWRRETMEFPSLPGPAEAKGLVLPEDPGAIADDLRQPDGDVLPTRSAAQVEAEAKGPASTEDPGATVDDVCQPHGDVSPALSAAQGEVVWSPGETLPATGNPEGGRQVQGFEQLDAGTSASRRPGAQVSIEYPTQGKLAEARPLPQVSGQLPPVGPDCNVATQEYKNQSNSVRAAPMAAGAIPGDSSETRAGPLPSIASILPEQGRVAGSNAAGPATIEAGGTPVSSNSSVANAGVSDRVDFTSHPPRDSGARMSESVGVPAPLSGDSEKNPVQQTNPPAAEKADFSPAPGGLSGMPPEEWTRRPSAVAGDDSQPKEIAERPVSVAPGPNEGPAQEMRKKNVVPIPPEAGRPEPLHEFPIGEVSDLFEAPARDLRTGSVGTQHITPLPASADNSALASRVIAQLVQAATALPNRPIELTLRPEELGKLSMTLQLSDGTMNVTIAAERPETQDFLRRNIDSLATQLRDLGYEKLSFSFSGDRQQPFHDPREQGPEIEDPHQNLPQKSLGGLAEQAGGKVMRIELGQIRQIDIRV